MIGRNRTMPKLNAIPSLFCDFVILFLYIRVLVVLQRACRWIIGVGPFWHPVIWNPLGLCWVQPLKDLSVVVALLDTGRVEGKHLGSVFHHTVGYLGNEIYSKDKLL